MRRALLLSAALLFAGAALADLSECLEPGEAIHPEDTVDPDECPQARALIERIGDRLTPPLPDEPTFDQLRDAEQFERALHPPAATINLHRAELERVMAEADPAREKGWWAQLKEWFTERLKRTSEESDWLESLMKQVELSDEAQRTVFYSAMVLLVALAVGVVVNELRVWRRSGPRGRAGAAGRGAGAPLPTEAEGCDWASLPQLPVRAQAAALWRCVLGLLSARGLVAAARGRTLREYRLALSALEAPWREDAVRLAAGAEQALFAPGDSLPDTAELAAAADRLRSQLEGR